MPGAAHSILGLVELANNVSDDTGNTTQILHDAFGHRLNDWLRNGGQWSFLNDTRACVILRDIHTARELELAAAELDSVFKEPHYHLGQALPLAVTAGFTEFSDHNSDLVQAMQEAGMALDQAKQAEHLFEIFSPDSGAPAQAENKLLEQMRAALRQNQFQLFYQPRIHARQRTLIGAEAQVHWHHSEQGIVTADKFIEVARKYDVIKPITWWSIRAAVNRLAYWPEQLSVAVSIYPEMLLEDDIFSVVKDALTVFGVNPPRLNLAINGCITADNQALMLDRIARLHDIGVTLSLEQFVSGCSSLALFRDLAVDELKIDRCFVERMLESDKDSAVVKSIIDLAHNFSLKAVAEGVQSTTVADRLAELHCDILLGPVFDTPLPAKDFEREYRLQRET